jgi:putative transcriptional regulator
VGSEPTPALRGRLLVATPPLVDPNFDRTVILVLEHGADGSLGLILNRPSATRLDEVLPEWNLVADEPAVVFVGGPVSPDAVIALARGTGEQDGWIPLVGDLGTVDIGRDPESLQNGLASLRVFVGYAGWIPGQLDDELAQHAWFVVDAEPSDPFMRDPDGLWRTVLRRQRGRVAIFASCPEDPSVN